VQQDKIRILKIYRFGYAKQNIKNQATITLWSIIFNQK
jgi:hypothetical protein